MTRSILIRTAVTSLIALSAVNATAMDMENVSVGGAYLGVFNQLTPVNQSSQFEYAANLDISYSLGKRTKGIVQFQSSTGGGSLGLGGSSAPLVSVTDLNIEYTMPNESVFTFGSFDAPLGQDTPFLTNNGDASNNPLLLNSLAYSALAGPAGTLNTVGIKGEKSHEYVDVTVAVSNGTGETSVNANNTFMYLIGLANDTILPGVSTSITYLQSDDRGDSALATSTGFGFENGFNTDFSAVMGDIHYQALPELKVSAYVGQYTYDDHVSNTKDDVLLWKVEGQYDINDKTFGAIRYSQWSPEDDNGTGVVNGTLASPGLNTAARTDEKIGRVQVGGGYELDTNLMLRAEFILDNYDKSEDIKGGVLFLSGTF